MSVGRIVIGRDGRVVLVRGGSSRRMGWVDKDRPVSSRAPWRGVREGGQERYGVEFVSIEVREEHRTVERVTVAYYRSEFHSVIYPGGEA